MASMLCAALGLTLHAASPRLAVPTCHSTSTHLQRGVTPRMNYDDPYYDDPRMATAYDEYLELQRQNQVYRGQLGDLQEQMLQDEFGVVDFGTLVPTGWGPISEPEPEQVAQPVVAQSGRNAQDIFFSGLKNLQKDPTGWFFGPRPSPLYGDYYTMHPSYGSLDPYGVGQQPTAEPSAKQLLQRVKDAGVAGAVSYACWELAFWAASVPVCLVAYYGVTGHLPDLSNQDDVAKLGAEAFAFVNLARFAVPLRIGLALSTVPWVQGNIIDKIEPVLKRGNR